MGKIQLYNRYNDKVYLEHIENDEYRLVVDLPEDENYTRYGYDGDDWPEGITFVDPSGGPYIPVGNITLSLANDDRSIKIEVDKIYIVTDAENKISETRLKIPSMEFIY